MENLLRFLNYENTKDELSRYRAGSLALKNISCIS